MDLYFRRHDGTAVTCDDFIAALADANSVDLSAFEGWYKQAGTPVLTATGGRLRIRVVLALPLSRKFLKPWQKLRDCRYQYQFEWDLLVKMEHPCRSAWRLMRSLQRNMSS